MPSGRDSSLMKKQNNDEITVQGDYPYAVISYRETFYGEWELGKSKK